MNERKRFIRASGKWLLPRRQAATDAQAAGFSAGVHRQLAPSAFIDSAKTEERVDEQNQERGAWFAWTARPQASFPPS